MKIPDRNDLDLAWERISKRLKPTPVLRSSSLDRMAEAELFFKCENFQKTGSFKARGAYNAVCALNQGKRSRGVATHSSGNHGQALAWAAQVHGLTAQVVMPENAPQVKKEATEGYGARITFCAPSQEARESTLKQVIAESGASFIPPYDHPWVIAGQSTCLREILAEEGQLDAVITPVGGGGLLSGTLLAARNYSQGLAVYGTEPEQADDAYRSIKSGVRVESHQPDTIADGLRTTLGELNFSIIRERVADILLVSEVEIIAAMKLIWERLKIIVEPSCAVPLAAVLRNPSLFRGKRVAIVLTGGNADLNALPF